jgi:acetyl esterase/lipase
VKVSIFYLFILTLTSCFAKVPEFRAPAMPPKVLAGIEYSVHQYRTSVPERSGQLGIAIPENAIGSLPVVVCIHGGGWAKGDKDQMAWMAIRYAQLGYIGVTVAYRLNHEAPLPACILDVKTAIRYLKSISKDVHIDPDRIAVLGYSAGAHLALMIGLSAESDLFKSKDYPTEDSSVQCVVAISAPTDFDTMLERAGHLNFLPEEKSSDPEFITPLSPINWIHEDQIPILLIHGDQDRIVPPYHYEKFSQKCGEFGISNLERYIHPDGNHTFFFRARKIVQPVINNFLVKNLN